jgi:XTP/dITP diphosphohydrolase
MTIKVFFATTNPGKVTSVQRVLSQYGIEVERRDIDLPELQGETASDVIVGKIRAAYERVEAPVMAIDSALHIDALNGWPGTDAKHATKRLGWEGYLALLRPIPCFRPDRPRTCRFEDAIGYMDASMDAPRVFLRKEPGCLADFPIGDWSGHKSPLAALFIPQGCDKTLAEMTKEEFLEYRLRPETEQVYHDLAKYILARER